MGNSNNHPERPSSAACPKCGTYHQSYRRSTDSGGNRAYGRRDIPFDWFDSRKIWVQSNTKDIPFDWFDSRKIWVQSETKAGILSNKTWIGSGSSRSFQKTSPGILSNKTWIGSGSRSFQETSPGILSNKTWIGSGSSRSFQKTSPDSGGNRAYGRRDIPFDSGENVADSETIDKKLDSGENVANSETIDINDSEENVADSEQRDIKVDSEGNVADSEQRDINDSEENVADSKQRGVICQYHLRGKCSWGSNCRDVHCDLPYQWIFRRRGSQVWTYFSEDDNVGIERAFCDPTNERHNVFNHEMAIDFNSMSGKDNADCHFEIERLSTPASVNHGNQTWRTKWLWYWRNSKGEWIKFEDRDNYEGYFAVINSAYLEETLATNPTDQASFKTTGEHSFDYIVDFRDMTLCNTNGTIRELRRRPEFINKVDFELNLLRSVRNADNAVTNGIKAPANWSIPKGTDLSEHNELVKLKETDPEYKEIKKMFIVENAVIISIKRIENGDLWEKYMMKKSKMLEKKNEEQLGEKRVFHGTDDNNVRVICEQGFDVRLAGTANGTDKGKGCYFAKDSTKAHNYTSKGTEYSTMFVTKILPGEYVIGNSSYCRPPHKGQSSDLYDSCVDDVKNPRTFVIFDNNQMYPEYVIRYKVMNIKQKSDHYKNEESQENCKLESVEPEDEYVEHDDEYVKPDDKYVEPVEPGDEYLEPVDPDDENVESVEPDDKSVEPVKPDDEYVEPVDPGDEYVESVEPDDKSAEPVKPDNEYVESVDPGDEYFESDDEYTE